MMNRTVLALTAVLLSANALAINKCVDKAGKVTFSDAECEVSSSPRTKEQFAKELADRKEQNRKEREYREARAKLLTEKALSGDYKAEKELKEDFPSDYYVLENERRAARDRNISAKVKKMQEACKNGTGIDVKIGMKEEEFLNCSIYSSYADLSNTISSANGEVKQYAIRISGKIVADAYVHTRNGIVTSIQR